MRPPTAGAGDPPTLSQAPVMVIGAGAAGLTAALLAAECGARVTLLNAHQKIGLKILMSGGTRCNVTHREVTERDYWGGSRPFVARVLRAFTPEQTREWFQTLGVELKLEESGKYFPVTDDARTVLEALLGAARRAGVEIVPGARVVRLERVGSAAAAEGEAAPGERAPSPEPLPPRYRLGIQRVKDAAAFSSGTVSGYRDRVWPSPKAEPDEWLEARSVVLATGGLSFPRTGSDGTGYALATALGHTLESPVPALTPLTASDSLCGEVQGMTLDAELTLWVGGKEQAVTRGSLLFTHFGYSGPAALDLSRHWLRSEGAAGRSVTASFFPGETVERLTAAWIDSAEIEPRRSVRRHLGQRLPDRLAVELSIEAGVDPSRPIAQVDRARRVWLLGRVLERELPVTGTLGYEKAEVTAGGVRLSEVDPSTLESRVSPGLFLCGEVLDVDGRLGGFNFQWAWSSGTVAGRAAGRIVSQVRQ